MAEVQFLWSCYIFVLHISWTWSILFVALLAFEAAIIFKPGRYLNLVVITLYLNLVRYYHPDVMSIARRSILRVLLEYRRDGQRQNNRTVLPRLCDKDVSAGVQGLLHGKGRQLLHVSLRARFEKKREPDELRMPHLPQSHTLNCHKQLDH